MRTWDTSAVVPLLADEPSSRRLKALYAEDPEMIVWWTTEVECVSAIGRRERERALARSAAQFALDRLDALRRSWYEVQPVDAIRERARRLVRTHALRSGDALQLAAGIEACEGRPDAMPFVCADRRLAAAAAREGLVVLGARLGSV